jgi:hypothetical protein
VIVNAGGSRAEAADADEAETPKRRAMIHIARRALALRPGDRLPNIDQLREEIGVGAGTVQIALRALRERDAITLKTRQHHGTILVARQLDALWRQAELGAVVSVLPLTNSWEFQGLASGLRAELDRLAIPSVQLYAHGSAQRVRAVREGRGHVAVTSAAAARAEQERSGGLRIAAELPPGSYYAADSVLVMARSPRAELPARPRIGIDRLSADHTWLTEAEFPDADYVDVSYAQLPSALRRGRVDAAVWHRTALGLSLADQHLVTWELAQARARQLAGQLAAAALLTRADDGPARGLVDEIDLGHVLAVQRDVVLGEVLPLY